MYYKRTAKEFFDIGSNRFWIIKILNQKSMHTIDLIIVITYLALCILIGLYKSRSIKTLKEYTLGHGYFSDIVIMTTLFATYAGAGAVMGNVGKVYTLGVFFIVTRLFSPLCWIISAKIYGQNIDQFKGLISMSDIMERLYGQIGRWVTNIASILAAIGVIAVQAAAMGHITNYFFGIGYHKSVTITVLILALYSSLGGIRAVALTDVFQFAVIMLAIPIACSFAYHDVGGYSGIMSGLPQNMLKLDLSTENIWLFLSLIFYSLLPESSGTFVQRFLICKNSKQLVRCLGTITMLSLPFTLIICLIGLIIRVKAPDINPDETFIYFISNYVSVGIKGLIIAGSLAVIMSTADSWLNTTSVLFTHDIISKIIPLTNKQALLMARTFTFLLCVLAIELTRKNYAVIELTWIADNFYVPLIVVPLAIGFLKFRTNGKSLVAAVTTAISLISISGYIVGGLGTVSLMCGMIGSAMGLLGMHYWQVHQGVLNVNTQLTKLTNANINRNADIGSKIALAESQCRTNFTNMYEDGEEKTKTIADELRKQSFIQGVEKGREEVARNLLLQGLDISIIENATGLSKENLVALQKSTKTAN